MTPADLGLNQKVIMDAVTSMFTTLAPFLLILISVSAVTIAVKKGISYLRRAGKGNG